MTHKIGAHLSSSGGYHKAVDSIVEKGGNCLQIFSSSPRTWGDSKATDEDIKKFVDKKHELKIDPVYFHACYLINCADPNETGKKSLKSLIFELNLAKKMEVKGSIVHTGSFKDGQAMQDNYKEIKTTEQYRCLIDNIKSILKETPKETLLILENAGNRKIGRTIYQLANIIDDVGDERVRVCLDTCHLHAAGYDLRTEEVFHSFLELFDKEVGLSKLEVVHMNDSKDPLASLRDRHENIGKGQVGTEVFKNFLNNRLTKDIPFIIETPGFDDKGPDKKNLDIVKSLIANQ